MSGSLGRVLVVDDDDVIRQLITVNLELEGFEVTTAFDGQDCLDKVKDVAPGSSAPAAPAATAPAASPTK